MKKTIIASLLVLSGCAAPLGQGPIAVQTHRDIRGTADYLESVGLKPRADVYRAFDAQLVACENAINASKKLPSGGVTGPLMALEIANVNLAGGISLETKMNCKPLPLIGFPGL